MALSPFASNSSVLNQSNHGWEGPPERGGEAEAVARSKRQREADVVKMKRKIALIERTIAAFEYMAANLDQEVSNEEERAKQHDPAHFAYPTYARACALRRDNLRRSAHELGAQLIKVKSHSAPEGEGDRS